MRRGCAWVVQNTCSTENLGPFGCQNGLHFMTFYTSDLKMGEGRISHPSR